jgi:hypothetical protein
VGLEMVQCSWVGAVLMYVEWTFSKHCRKGMGKLAWLRYPGVLWGSFKVYCCIFREWSNDQEFRNDFALSLSSSTAIEPIEDFSV